jgi:hypothetical protein
MAARHLGIPLWWRTILRPRPEEKRIYFTHIGGITKGMEVFWIFNEAQTSGFRTQKGTVWDVEIQHEFNPRWPPVGRWFAGRVIGEMFVKQVANKTLTRLKQNVESRTWDVERTPWKVGSRT